MNHETKYSVHNAEGKWLMTTNANDLMNVLRCSHEAMARIEAEAGPYGIGKPCEMHFIRFTPWATNDYLIYIA